jgi:hypothetical protein
MRGKMTYTASIGVVTVAGAASMYVFRLNSVYDPDFTGTGTTAYTYTQMAANYGRYRVLGFRAFVTFKNTTTSPQNAIIALSPATTVGTSISQIMSQRHVWMKPLASKDGNGIISHAVSGTVGKVYGVPEAQVRTEDDFASVAGANPNNGIYLHVGFFQDVAAGTASMLIRIEYDVVWSLPLETSP